MTEILVPITVDDIMRKEYIGTMMNYSDTTFERLLICKSSRCVRIKPQGKTIYTFYIHNQFKLKIKSII